MMRLLRLFRIAGAIVVTLAALTAAGGQAMASTCVLGPSSGAVGSTYSISNTAGGLTGTTSVTFGSNPATILLATDTEVQVAVPDEPAPTVTSVATFPFGNNYGSTNGGDTLIIHGSNFDPTVNVAVTGGSCAGTYSFTYSNDVTAVDIGGTAAPFVNVTSSSTITVTTPPGIAGVTSVIVDTTTQNSGASGSNIFAYVPGGPSVSGIGPQIGLTTIAQPVTISGNNFITGTFQNGTPATTVTFYCGTAPNSQPLGATVTNLGSISLTAPTCGTPGAVQVVVTTPAGSASGTYQYVAPGTPQVTSITPNTGTTQGGTMVTINGANFIGATMVTFGTVSTTGFTVTSAGQIATQTPAQSAAGPVNVTVTVNNGTTSVTSTQTVTFNYTAPPPVVNTIAPTSGSTAGGTAVTIYGQYFTGATQVQIGGTNVTSFAVASDTQITAVTAPHAAGANLNVVVTTPTGTGTGANLYTYGTPAPTVSSVAPNSGGIGGGQSVTITGTAFTGTTSVTFGGTAATTFTVNSDTSITATTPAHAAGIVDVAVTTAAGTGTGTDLYSYAASPPTVTSISPTNGSTLGGTQVTIKGTNFNGTPQVTIGGVAAAEVTVVNSTTLTAVTPAGTGTNVPVVVTTSFGTSTAADIYTYQAPTPPAPSVPTVTSFTPTSGTTLGLTLVTITGTNLTGATSVTFGANLGTNVTVVNSTTVTVLTPPGTGSVAVAVTTPGGTATAPTNYQYVTAPPTVTAVNPHSGTNLGGSSVTITGTNFTGATAVTFGGSPATSVTVLTATTITATTPAGTGTVNVAVTTPAGTGTGLNLYTYVAQSPPTVTAITPNGGSIANGGTIAGGIQVTIAGTNFTGATAVTFGGTAATFMTVTSPTTITAVTPPHAAGAVNVVVTTPAGTGTGTNLFTYVVPPPTLTSISPANGPTAGGTAVTITGTNFISVTSVTIGGNAPTAVTVVSSTSITATTPAGAAGPANVVVTTSAGTATGANLFTFVAPPTAPPTVTTVAPSTGPPGGGTIVTIIGTNFNGATAVTFGATKATFFTVNSSTSMTATSPPGTSTVNVTVTTPGGTSATGAGDQFSYAKATTSLTLTSSPNPSVFGQPVTFTAKVTGSAPTGTVTFSEGALVLGTATLVAGTATFTIAALPIGHDPVTASYGGDANNAPDPQTVLQIVNGLSDSVKLRQMQIAAMPIASNITAQAITGAIDSAITGGFSGFCPAGPTPNGAGFTYCFGGGGPLAQNGSPSAPQEARARIDNDFAALGYSGDLPGTRWSAPQDTTSKDMKLASDLAPRPAIAAVPYVAAPDWLAWVDVRATDYRQTSVGNDIKDLQGNAMFGLTRRVSSDFLFGVTAGYENFDFTSQAYNGVLKGQGATAGAYVGWRFGHLRFEAAGTWSDVFVSSSSGTASGNFSGTRWLGFGGVTGDFAWFDTLFEPTAQVYTLWEHENGYTDSLGTQQADNNFDTGRASGGLKISHAFPMVAVTITPYVGFFADYYFSMNSANAAATAAPTVPLIQGWGGRTTGGVTIRFPSGAQLGAGGEFSGIGSNIQIWTVTVRGSVPF